MPNLDRIQSLAHIEALEPSQFAASLATELPDEVEARDGAFAAALHHIDDFAGRVMRVQLEHALATDTSIAMPTRKVFASTIVGYANNLPLLARRVRDLAAGGRARDPDAVVQAVLDAANRTLSLRDAVRAPVLALVRARSLADLPEADRRARDRTLADPERKRWSAVRRELEAMTEQPERVLAAFATRIASWPEQLDEPEPTKEPTLAELIELD